MSSISNDEVIELFKYAEQVKNDTAMSPEQIDKQVKEIHNKIIQELSFLAYSNAKSYRKFSNYEDLVQEGLIGLLKAVRRFDYTRYPNFFLYAQQWIRHSVKRSASRFDVVYNPERKRVVYAEITSDANGKEEEYPTTPEDTFFAKEIQTRVTEVLSEFSERDREIVKRIFGLGDQIPQTLREIGPDFNLTYERVRQIKNNVISKLKKNQVLNDLY
jgi:RNA polymerase primary sigma factor